MMRDKLGQLRGSAHAALQDALRGVSSLTAKSEQLLGTSQVTFGKTMRDSLGNAESTAKENLKKLEEIVTKQEFVSFILAEEGVDAAGCFTSSERRRELEAQLKMLNGSEQGL